MLSGEKGRAKITGAGTYYIIVDALVPGTIGTFDMLIQSAAAAPAGDECPGAQLQMGVPVTASLELAGDDIQLPCNTWKGAPDVYYTFTNTGRPLKGVTFSTCFAGTTFDTILTVFLLVRGSFTCPTDSSQLLQEYLICNDDYEGCGTSSQIDLSILRGRGSTFWVVIEPADPNADISGTFELLMKD